MYSSLVPTDIFVPVMNNRLFFSSLKQLEKRLKLDDENPPPPPPSLAGNPQPETTQTQATESLSSSPIYFYNQPTTTSSTLQDNSTEQPPQEFLSYNNIDEIPPSPHRHPPQLDDSGSRFSESSTADDIDSLIQILGLSDFDEKGPEMPDFGDDEFYDKIVKVKGPKCKKEVERLDGWIKYLLKNGRREPLRLTHLLLAEASFVSWASGGGDGGAGLEFPATVDGFLQNDPPSD